MKLLFRKLLLVPFYLLILAVDATGRILQRAKLSPKPKSAFCPGISIVIPERANRERLLPCLQSLRKACAELGEPEQATVVVTRGERDMHHGLTQATQAACILR